MKVLHIIDSGGLYGAEIMLLNLVHAQSSMGYEPTIASIGDKGIGRKAIETEALKQGIEIIPFRMRPGPNFFGAMKIKSYALSQGFQILHSHGYKGNILFGLLPKFIRRLPLVATLHGWTGTDGFDKLWLYEKIDKFSLKFADAIVLVSSDRKQRITFKNKQYEKRLFTIENGLPPVQNGSGSLEEIVKPDPLDVSTHRNIGTRIIEYCRQGTTIGCIGRLSKEKGHRYLIKALPLLLNSDPEIRLIIIGEGDARLELEHLIKRLHLSDKVLMPGHRINARQYMPFFDAFVLPSLTEGLPITLLEAMQEGVPVVASRVGGIPNVIEDKKTGLLTAPGDTHSLTKAIKILLGNDRLAKLIRTKARELVNTHYTSNAMAKKYSTVYQAVLSRVT